MAMLIAIAVVVFIVWQSQQAQRRRNAAAPPPLPAPASASELVERPFADAPRVIAPARRPAASPWEARQPSPTAPTDVRGRYAFASTPDPRHPDRTARMACLARGKGLCSPRH